MSINFYVVPFHDCLITSTYSYNYTNKVLRHGLIKSVNISYDVKDNNFVHNH